MAYVIINEKHLEAIADALRKVGGKETYKPREMAPDIERLSGGTGFNGLLGKYFNGVDVPGAAFELMIEDCVNEDGTLFLPENMWTGKTIKGDIVIPYGIVEIPDNYFKNVEGITDVDFPLGLTTIGTGAFRNAINGPNDTITLGLDVTNIGQYAFADNTLKVFRTSENEVAIDDYAFQNIILEKLELNGDVTIDKYAFRNASINEIEINGNVSIGEKAFEHTTYNNTTATLEKITINGEITSVGPYAFQHNTKLTEVNGELKTLSEGIFYKCNKLESVALSDELTAIPANAFYWCALRDITIPSNVTTIGANAFNACGNYDGFTVTLNEGLQNIGDSAFESCYFYEITLPETLQTIGAKAFSNTKLYAVSIPGGVKTISEYAFYYCEVLDAVKFNEGLEVIDRYAFADDHFLRGGLSFPSTLKRINSNAFVNCYEVTSVSFKEGLEIIEGRAFYNCYKLTGVSLPASLQYIDLSAFGGDDPNSSYYGTYLTQINFKLSPDHQLDLGSSRIQMSDEYPDRPRRITFKGQGGQIPKASNSIFATVNTANTTISVPWSESENPSGFPWGATKATIIYNNGL